MELLGDLPERSEVLMSEYHAGVWGCFMKFIYNSFICDVDVFRSDNNVVIRFYDSIKEQSEEQIRDLTIVDSGYGFLCFKRKGESGLVSGFLDNKIFSSDKIINEAVDFLERCCNVSWGHVPYHIDRFSLVDYCEYNGEY